MIQDRYKTLPSQLRGSDSRYSEYERPPRPLPNLACDCHIHILGPDSRYPFSTKRQYTPMDASVPEAMQMMTKLGCTRAVIVQPSVYGTDNSCTLDAVDTFPISARSIIVIPPDIQADHLIQFREKGAQGIRLNGTHWNSKEFEQRLFAYEPLFDQMKQLDWHVECFIGSQIYPAMSRVIESSDLNLVLDHWGGIFQENETIEERINDLDFLMRTGRVWIKLSGPYRLRDSDVQSKWYAPLLNHLLKNYSDRLIWGSDWPHTPDRLERQKYQNTRLPFQNIDTCRLLETLLSHIQDSDLCNKIFIKNPEYLYHF